jgi:hypothetical protein
MNWSIDNLIQLNTLLLQYNIEKKYIAINICMDCQKNVIEAFYCQLNTYYTPLKMLMGFEVHTSDNCILCKDKEK